LISQSQPAINLLFLIYDLERGGPELRLLDFQENFPAQIGMHICVTSKNKSLFPDFLRSNARIIFVPVKRGYLEINKAWQIYKYIKNEHVTIINSFALKELFLAATLKLFSNGKIKMVYHAVEMFDHFEVIQKLTLRALLKFSDRIICNSKNLKFQLQKKLSVNAKIIWVITNGIDTTRFKKTPNDSTNASYKNSLTDEIIIGTVANFRKEKNYPFLIGAFNVLAQKHPNLRLLCVGGGSLLNEMKRTVKLLNLEKKITFTGYAENIVKYLSLMDFFVLCSEREGFPNSLLQAMSMEIPVLSSDVGGCAEIIDHGITGMLYPPDNSEKFIDSLDILIQNKPFAVRIAANGRKKIEEDFTLERMIADYVDFYKELSEC